MAAETKLREYLRRVTAELLETRERLAGFETTEPIAVVGMACRLPGGVGTADDLWRLCRDGRTVTGPVPTDRHWDLDVLSGARGGFLDRAGDFDAEFFGISPREAGAIDPQHRLLLEVSWEALEHACLAPDRLRDSATGVWAGVMSGDHVAAVTTAAGSGAAESGFYVQGTSGSFASGRISYALGLRGPSVSLDTACSSSLVALHDACRSLRAGECSTALVAGATVMSTPSLLVEFTRQGGLAADGRCKAFAAAADGTVFSEGAAVVVLERLADARRAGRRVWAVVRGSAVNSDGASNGITAPSVAAQEQVIRAALRDADIAPADVDVVEAHGTGTTLGDPIEARALAAAYGGDRPPGRPLLLGSVKSNLGHTQAAAGLVGLIKLVGAMHGGVVPPTLGVDEPSPHVDWAASGLRLVTEPTPWPAARPVRRAAISAFSLSGTNVHVVVENDGQAEPAPPEATPDPAATAWVLSARTPTALREQARILLGHLERAGDGSPGDADVALSLATGRAQLSHRAVVVGRDGPELRRGVAHLAAGGADTATDADAALVVRGTAVPATGRGPVFVFPGQGSQWNGMGRDLMAGSEVFADQVRACDAAFTPHLDFSVADVIAGRDGAARPEDPAVVQPVLFTVMVALAALWRAHGVEPSAVVGHSQGEVAAAYVAGALGLEDAALVVARRHLEIRRLLAGTGAMAWIGRDADEVTALLARSGEAVSVAARNGPSATAVAGDPDPVARFVATCREEGIRARVVAVDYASHCAAVDPVVGELRRALAPVAPRASEIGFVSTVTGGPLDGAALTGDYWAENLRRPVEFAAAVETLLADGHDTFVECSPHPVLTAAVAELADRSGSPGECVVAGTLRRDEGEPRHALAALAAVHVRRGGVDWSRARPPHARPVVLPPYPFERTRYWTGPGRLPAADVTARGLAESGHPLVSTAVDTAGSEDVLVGRISTRSQPWLADHTVAGTVVLPGTACLDLVAHAAGRRGLGVVGELSLHVPVVLGDGDEGVVVQVLTGAPDGTGARPVTVWSRPDDESDRPWTHHGDAIVLPHDGAAADPRTDPGVPGGPPPAGADPVDLGEVYERLADGGLGYGPTFRGLRKLWRSGGDLVAEVVGPEPDDAHGYTIHPALLDAVLHALPAADAGPADRDAPLMPFAWEGVRLSAPATGGLRVLLSRSDDGRVALYGTDSSGRCVVRVDALTFRRVDPSALGPVGREGPGALLATAWSTAAPPPPPAAGTVAILGEAIDVPGAGRYADLDSLRADLDEGVPAPAVAIFPVPLAPAGADGGIRSALSAVLALVQGWLTDERLSAARLAVVTRAAFACPEGGSAGADDADPGPPDPAAAAVAGLVRSVQAEHPDRVVLVDLDEHGGGVADLGAVAGVATGGEPRVALRGGLAHVPRLCRVRPSHDTGHDAAPAPSGTVLVTGAFGTLGGLVARHWVTARGARRILLLGRRGLDTPGADDLVADLERSGATVTALACDVSDRAALAGALSTVPAEHPLSAVVHTAGTLDDATVLGLTPEHVDRVLGPKVDAALHLDELTHGSDLAEFVLFSSLAGTLGHAGQANYAAANAALDALALRRRALGRPAQALAWGLWAASSGLTGAHDRAALGRGVPGLSALGTADALALMDLARVAGEPVVAPLRLDPAALRSASEIPPEFEALAGRRAGSTSRREPTVDLGSISDLPEPDALRLLTEVVCERAATVLGHEAGASAVAADRTFADLGVDSLLGVELRNRLAAATGLRLPATLVFDRPTPAAVAAFLRMRLTGEPDDPVLRAEAVIENLRAAAGPLDEPARDALAARLRVLAREWSSHLDASIAGDAEVVQTAGAEELFALLDHQLDGA